MQIVGDALGDEPGAASNLRGRGQRGLCFKVGRVFLTGRCGNYFGPKVPPKFLIFLLEYNVVLREFSGSLAENL